MSFVVDEGVVNPLAGPIEVAGHEVAGGKLTAEVCVYDFVGHQLGDKVYGIGVLAVVNEACDLGPAGG